MRTWVDHFALYYKYVCSCELKSFMTVSSERCRELLVCSTKQAFALLGSPKTCVINYKHHRRVKASSVPKVLHNTSKIFNSHTCIMTFFVLRSAILWLRLSVVESFDFYSMAMTYLHLASGRNNKQLSASTSTSKRKVSIHLSASGD